MIVQLVGDDPAAPVPRDAAPTTTTPWRPPAAGCVPLAELTPHQRAAQLVMVHVDGAALDELGSLTGRLDPPGGILVSGTTQEGFDDGRIASLLDQRPTLVAIDDEGGRVVGLAEAAPSAREQADRLSVDEIRELAARRGRTMRRLGVDVDFAPVVDTAAPGGVSAIGDRSYSEDPERAERNAGAFAEGLREAEVLPTLKHFPGHGRAAGDSHNGVATTPQLADLEDVDLLPYPGLIEDGPVAVMVGHLDVPDLTEPGRPASLSPAAYEYLRSEIGFDGLAVTDELGAMAAVTSRFGVPEAVVQALVAGADLALVGPVRVYGDVLTAIDAAIADGGLTDDRIDDALTRVRLAQGCAT